MYVSVGSYSNVQERGENETDRAAIFAFDPEGGKRRIFASGLRNPVSLSVSPVTGGCGPRSTSATGWATSSCPTM